MKRDEKFNETFVAYGGRLKRDECDPELVKILEDWLGFFRNIISEGQKGKEFITGDIIIDYVGNPSVNAIATQSGRQEYVGLFLGATMFLYDAFAVLVTQPNVFEGSGHSSAVPAKETIKKLLTRPHPHRFLDVGDTLDQTRWKLAQSATMITQFFLFGHEVGHLIYGHLRYLMAQSSANELVEFPAAALDSNASQIRRVLEFDADMHGSIVSLNWWGRLSEQSDQDLRFGQSTFYMWGFSLGIMFRLMDQFTTQPSVETSSTHPMPDIRFAHCFVCGLEEVMKRFPDRVEEFKVEVERASTDLQRLWDTFDLPAPSFESWRANLGEDVAFYRSRWEKLKDEHLDPLAFVRSDEIRASHNVEG